MENIREIFCGCCCEVACEYDLNKISGSSLHDRQCACQSCGVIGRLIYDGDLRLVPVEDQEIPCMDFSVIVEGYEASQRALDRANSEIAYLRSITNRSFQVDFKGKA